MNLKEKLFKELLKEDLSKEEEKQIEEYIDYIVSSFQPVYNYIDELEKDKEKIKDVISIIDLIKKGKK